MSNHQQPRPSPPPSPSPSPQPPPLLPDSWDRILPGPPSRSNFGAADLNHSGLLAFAAGSSIAVVDSRSMQLVATIPMPPPPSSSSSSFVTAVRWSPLPLSRDLLSSEISSSSHLLLAAGDRQGRIAVLDLHLRAPHLWLDSDLKLGIQDLCWVRTGIIAAVAGPSSLSLYNAATGRCFWRYDAGSEYLSCLRRDPFDSRHFCTVGLKGFLLSVKVLGENENEVVIKEMQIRTDASELLRLEKESAAANGGGGSSSSSAVPATAAFPNYPTKIAFSPRWRNIVFAVFPKELMVFDMKYEAALFTVGLPRACGKFVEVLPDPDSELLYCAHYDGKLSTWRRKEGEQVHYMCSIEELMPSLGTSVPSPSVLSVIVSQSDSSLQSLGKLYSNEPEEDFDSPFDFCDEPLLVSKSRLLCISDDGKIWNWVMAAEGSEDMEKEDTNTKVVSDVSDAPVPGTKTSTEGLAMVTGKKKSSKKKSAMSFKISLAGQLQLLSSQVTMLAVPSPSLTATLARGGNYPAVPVPLVSLGTQSGTIDVVDVSANAVASSFSVHSGMVRGLRWLGNSRVVSFSYTQVNEKSGSYINRLIVTCLRSGFNRPFRVLQKPERAPIRAIRTSSSGRYLLILFRDAQVEVWAMTKTPIMLRSLALPFTVLEWTLPTVPRPGQNVSVKETSSSAKDREPAAQDGESSTDSKTSDGSQDDTTESFAFALVNGALGVFEVQGRRIRDFRPKWPSSSFVSSDGLITAMAYRLPHVVMGDRSGNIRWWDVTTGHSSSFSTHREGIRRIKFSSVAPGDRSRGRIAVLFYDNTFSIFDLDSPDPMANSLLKPQFPGTLVVELDWIPLRADKNDPLVLCVAGADSSVRFLEVNVNEKKLVNTAQLRYTKERFRPVPLCCPILFPTPHALALRTILQLGVRPDWFNTSSTVIEKRPHLLSGTPSSSGDLRSYMIDLPAIGDPVVPELLLKILEPYRKEGCILDDERAKLYAKIVTKGFTARLAFAASVFGESSEALFWLQLPRALNHLMRKLVNKPNQKVPVSTADPGLEDIASPSRATSKSKSVLGTEKRESSGQVNHSLMAFEQEELWANANERITWHEKLEGEEVVQNRVHELVSVGNLEDAVSLLLSTNPESKYFYVNALRAVALASAVSNSLLELAVKVVAANMVQTDRSMSGTHLLCAVGRYQEACSQLQDAGCWTDAATLAATHLEGSDYARVLHRWADHVRHTELNLWRALILYVAAGALEEALAVLREAHQPDTAAMFVLACREIHSDLMSKFAQSGDQSESSDKEKLLKLPELDLENDDVLAASEYYGMYQRKLVHLCMDSQPYSD